MIIVLLVSIEIEFLALAWMRNTNKSNASLRWAGVAMINAHYPGGRQNAKEWYLVRTVN